LRGFLNDSGHSVYVGDLPFERAALDAPWMVGRFCDPEVRVVDERGQDALEANALLEAARPTPNCYERLGHSTDAKALDGWALRSSGRKQCRQHSKGWGRLSSRRARKHRRLCGQRRSEEAQVVAAARTAHANDCGRRRASVSAHSSTSPLLGSIANTSFAVAVARASKPLAE